MKFSKKNIMIVLFFLLFCLACLVTMTQRVVVEYHESSTIQASGEKRIGNLHALLCEEIKLGMTKEQVVSILEKKGKLEMDGFFNQPSFDLHVNYTDPTLFELYGNFTIVISNNMYVESFVNSGFESYQTICSIR
jgi:hypothetical protein